MPSGDEIYQQLLNARAQALDKLRGLSEGVDSMAAAARPALGRLGASMSDPLAAVGAMGDRFREALPALRSPVDAIRSMASDVEPFYKPSPWQRLMGLFSNTQPGR